MHADPKRLMRSVRFYIGNKLFFLTRKEKNAMLGQKLKQPFIYWLDYMYVKIKVQRGQYSCCL